MPQEYDASKEWADKKVVLVSVPGAFTPGCQARHLPPYINNLDKILEKGVDLVAVIAFNDAWVVSLTLTELIFVAHTRFVLEIY